MPPEWKMTPTLARAMVRSAAVIRREKRRALFMCVTSSSNLEPNILESLSRGAVEVCCKPVVAAPRSQVATCDPRGRAVAGGAELAEAGLGRGERALRLVEATLLEQGASEHELRAPDLVEVVLVAGGLEQLERVPRLLLCLLDVAGAQVNLCE